MSATATSTAPQLNRKPVSNPRNRPPHPSNPNQLSPAHRKKPPGSRSHANPSTKPKPVGSMDFIDTLDTIGGFHHDGPFDAASSHRNRDTNSKNPSRQAPMAAFDPSALILPPPPPPASATSSSSRYPPEHLYPPDMNRRGSDASAPVSMGYPAGTIASDPKAARLAEAFGIQGREAWEDFGMERPQVIRRVRDTDGSSAPGSTIFREERDAKAASVWDMEATIRSGKPVPSEEPKPLSPSGLRSGSGESDRAYPFAGGVSAQSNTHTVRRSKSLMQRIKKGVKSPNLPIDQPIRENEVDPQEAHEAEDRVAALNFNQTGPSDPPNKNSRPVNQTGQIGRKTSLLVKFGLAKNKSFSRP